jgi:uncharacterized protein YbjT (DUF2867 family)
MAQRTILAGATGLVGRLVADRLLGAGCEVEALVRRPTGRKDPRWHEHVAPLGDWAGLTGAGADVAVSALGTTMKQAGSQAAFRAVDFDLVVDFARAVRAAGVRHMIVISSAGADPAAANFYLRVKGEMEQALAGLGFDRLDIVRPGLLRGVRGADRRLGERAAILVSPLLNLVLRGRLDRYAAIDASIVADAVAALVRQSAPGNFVHHNRDLLGCG